MADVASTLAGWSSTTASNAPAGSTTIGTGLDDNLREIQGVIVRGLSHKGADIASVAGTTDIGAVEGLMHDITGTNAITGLGTVRAGIFKILKFEAAASLTHNATSLILPGGANITCADGDVGFFISEGSGNWRCLHYMKASGGVLGPVMGAVQASTSGQSIDFTGIPSWVKKITVSFVGVSVDSTSTIQLQLGDSGGVEDSGYLGGAAYLVNTSSVGGANLTSGFAISQGGSAASVLHGIVTLVLHNAASFTWVASGSIYYSNTAAGVTIGGSKSLSAALDRIRITTTGSDAFDAGSINVLYE